jgi:hypothetical protein
MTNRRTTTTKAKTDAEVLPFDKLTVRMTTVRGDPL